MDFRVESDNNTHALFVKGSDGVVGIGDSTPEHQLEVKRATGKLARFITQDDNNGATNPLSINYNASLRLDNQYSGAAPSAQGTKVAKIQLSTVTTSGYGAYGAIVLDANTGTGHDSGEMSFALGANSSNLMTERMRIDKSGSLLVGVTSANHLANANAVQLIQGDYGQAYVNHATGTSNGIYYINFTLGGSEIGSIKQANSTSVNYNTTSDYRLKENVEDISDSITRVKQLQPRRFNFITEPDITCDGFLAHEVSTVVPEAVSGEKDEVQVWGEREERPDGVSVGDNKLDEDGNTIIKPQGIDHSKLVPLLTAAIQELSAKNDALEARIATLEG